MNKLRGGYRIFFQGGPTLNFFPGGSDAVNVKFKKEGITLHFENSRRGMDPPDHPLDPSMKLIV